MGFFNEKKRVSIAASPLSQEPLSAGSTGSRHSGFASPLPELEMKDSKYKKLIRVLRFITRFISLILNVLMTTVLTWALYKYYTTRSHSISPSSTTSTTTTPWLTPTTLWPTFVLLGIAVVTFFMNLLTLIAYCCSVRAANKTNTFSTIISYIFLGVHVVLWGVAVGAFKMGSNGRDLWGYSCSSTADKIAEEVKSYLDFGKLCQYQTTTYYISILETTIYLLTFIITILTLFRSNSKKKLRKGRESLNVEAGYDGVELRSGKVGLGLGKSGRRYMPLAG